jgi:hypothetical protein
MNGKCDTALLRFQSPDTQGLAGKDAKSQKVVVKTGTEIHTRRIPYSAWPLGEERQRAGCALPSVGIAQLRLTMSAAFC